MERVVMVVVVTNLRSVANHLRDVAVTASEGRVPMPEGAQTGA
jgi:hypothetical protein